MPALDTAPVSIRTTSQPSDSVQAKAGQPSNDASQAFDQQLEAEIKRTSPNKEPVEAEKNELVETEQEKPEINVPVEVTEQELLLQSVIPQTTEGEIYDLSIGNELPVEDTESAILPATMMTPQRLVSDELSPEQTGISRQHQSQQQRPMHNLQTPVDPLASEESALKDADFAKVLAQPDAKKSEVQVAQAETSLTRELPELSRSVRGQTVQMTALNLSTDASTKDVTSQLTQQLQLNTPVTQKSWGQEFSQRISMMMTNSQQQVAELQLNPARMGSISVRVSLDDDKANISFVTTQTAVKEAIEVSLPRLKEQLEQQGLDLGHVDVSSQDAEQASEDEAGREMRASQDESETEIVSPEEINLFYQQSDGVSVFV